MLLAFSCVAPTLRGEPSALEYRIKAAFLYNFVRFVEWPREAAGGDGEPLVLGLLGSDPFGPILDKTVRGKTVQGRPLRIRRFASVEELQRCHLIFISSSERKQVAEILETLEDQHVLTVSEMDGFLGSGGVINFVIDEETVRFEVNLAAAERADLRVSSQLLKVAKAVTKNP